MIPGIKSLISLTVNTSTPNNQREKISPFLLFKLSPSFRIGVGGISNNPLKLALCFSPIPRSGLGKDPSILNPFQGDQFPLSP